MKIMNLNYSRFVCDSFKLMVNHVESMIEVKFENKSFIYYYYTRQDSMLILTESCNLSKKCKKKNKCNARVLLLFGITYHTRVLIKC